MNETIVIRIPTNVASKVVSRCIAVAVVGTLLGLFMMSSGKSRYETFKGASAEQQKTMFDQYQRNLEESANRDLAESIVVGGLGAVIFCGVYEFLAFLSSVVCGWFYRVDSSESDTGEAS